MKAKDLKEAVKSKYEGIVLQNTEDKGACCCGSTGCCEGIDYSVFSDDYTNQKGYNPEADLGLGCGIPTDFAGIKEGATVLDLGSGAGNDVFVARSLVGESGKVTGLDFTEAMVKKARENLKKTGYSNIEFVLGDIESMPLDENTYDVVISNCVLNLVPDKNKAFREIFRVLKPGGHFCISDVVLMGNLPEKLREEVELYAGCVSGALPREEYLSVIEAQGFQGITVHKEKQIAVPDELIEQYLEEWEISEYRSGLKGIFSITVSGRKG